LQRALFLFRKKEVILSIGKFGKPTLTAIVPVGKNQVPMGTVKSILRQANLREEDFK
jgi:hypothetical protein